MVTTSWTDLTSGRSAIPGPVALTIGSFDGIHCGHRAILKRLVEHGTARGGTAASCMVLTFRQHPRAVLTGAHPGTLTTLRQRQERFAALGATHMVLIDFSAQFSKLTGGEFIGTLQSGVALQTLVVGVDFRCGRGRDTDVVQLKRLLALDGVGVVAVAPVAAGDQAVSSTRIRAAVRAGEFVATRQMMGLPFEVDLRAAFEKIPSATSFRPGSELHITPEQVEQILPQPGAYAASVVMAGGGAVATTAAVADDGVRCKLPEGTRRAPVGLQFHGRAEQPLLSVGTAVPLRTQEK